MKAKKFCILLLLGFALLAILSQCKKDNSVVEIDKTAEITLNVNKSTKLAVDPPQGTVDFENGDVIHVVSNGVYVGFLTHDGNSFVGTITNPVDGLPLYFYFLGNQNPSLTVGGSTSCYVNIMDQTENLPVISAAPSNENYDPDIISYSAELQNKCALVKFNVTTPSSAAICLTGMNNRVAINFSTNEFTYSQIQDGTIRLAGENVENVEKWAILFPQDALSLGEAGSAYSADGAYSGVRPAIPAITNNLCLPNGIDFSVNTYCLPDGAIKGLFSVSATKRVYFSQGNLQYNPKFKLWQFAYPQYSMLHTGWTGDSNVSSEYTSTYNGWIDMFGWATSGTYHGAICHFPYSTDQTDSKYYAYGNASYNLYDRNGAADWGCNSISNGGEQTGLWRTPTRDEWNYLLNSRSTPSGIRFAKATISGVKGLILLPDHWDTLIYTLSNANNSSSGYSNTITESDWQTCFESNGAVFLPAAGWRDYINVIQSYDYYGYYWASDCFYIPNYSQNNPYCLRFSYNALYTMTRSRHYGCSVRLIQDKAQ